MKYYSMVIVGNETESCGTVVRLRLNWPGLILTIVVG